MLDNNTILTILLYLFYSFIISYFSIKITLRFYNKIYYLSLANHKSSSYHEPLFRGVGITYILPLIPIIILQTDLLSLREISILLCSTLLGYIDDKRGLSQRIKLLFLILIFLSFNYEYITMPEKGITWLIMHLVFYIFFVLFFNQIDGINGLSTLTFLTFISLIFFFTNFKIMSVFLLVPIAVSILVYLNFNMRLKKVLQGDSGSYFTGAFSYLIISRYENEIEILYSLFFLLPLLIDVSLTSISRVLYGKKLFEGHRDNIYQQLTVKYKRHSFVTISIISTQLLLSIFVIIFYKYFSFYHSVLLNLLLFMFVCVLWYKFHLKFNVKEI